VRYPAEQKAETREKIIAQAARSFREHGGENNGIGSVMKAVGLTKGGFYRHFESKDDLYVEAVARAFDELGAGMVEAAKSAPQGQQLRAIIERYLSPEHLNAPGRGCVLAALGPELARQPLAVRKRINQIQQRHRERLVPFIPGETFDEKYATCSLLFPAMAGVLVSARATVDQTARERMLARARKFFIESFVR
jgi:TetR/AcrR family transcriptional repressor of nem operon